MQMPACSLLRGLRRAALACACLSATLALAQAPAPLTVVHCEKLFDPVAGKLLGPTTVTVAGDKFDSVEAASPPFLAQTHASAPEKSIPRRCGTVITIPQ